MPILTLSNGVKISQTQAILRYVAKCYKGKNGECLYPGVDNPNMTYEIDMMM